MADSSESAASASVVLLLLALFLLASPLTVWWMRLTPPWYFPYLVWLGLIVLGAALARWLGRHEL